MKYKNIKKDSIVLFQWNGLAYKAKYTGRYFNNEVKSWFYVFSQNDLSVHTLQAKDVQLIAYMK